MKKLELYTQPWNLILYAITFLALMLDSYLQSDVPIYLVALLFLVWDIGYVRSKKSFTGREYTRVSDLVDRIRNYMSWYMVFYGLFFGLLLTGEQQQREAFLSLLQTADMSFVMLALPFILSSIGFVFLPIQSSIGQTVNAEPLLESSSALKANFIVVVYCQQMSTILLFHSIIRLILPNL